MYSKRRMLAVTIILLALFLLFALVAVAVAAPEGGLLLYVDGITGTDLDNDCRSAGAPCATIQHAIDSGDARVENRIRIAPATYVESLTIDKRVVLDGEPKRPALVILQAPISQRAIAITTDLPVVIQDMTIAGGKARSAPFASGGGIYSTNGAPLTLVGVTLEDHIATDSGGAIYSAGGDVTISTSLLRNNLAAVSGGAVFVSEAMLHVENSTLRRNVASSSGGAIFVDGDATIVNSHVITNEVAGTTSAFGGALFHQNGALTISSATISQNSVDGATTARGAAIYTSMGSFTVENSIFADNTALTDGRGGALYLASDAHTIDGSTFERNSSNIGGAIYGSFNVDDTLILTITDSTIEDNRAKFMGGGLYISNGTTTLNNVTMSHNETISTAINTSEYGGAVAVAALTHLVVNGGNFSHNVAGDSGGGIYLSADAVVLINQGSFAYNRAGERGGAISAPFTTISGTSFIENIAGSGGAISIAGGSIGNSSFLRNRADATSGGALDSVFSTTDVTITATEFISNSAALFGGAAIVGQDTQINNSLFSENTAFAGGAIYASGGVTVAETTVQHNVASEWGGGISAGGAQQFTLLQSTLFDNEAAQGGGIRIQTDAELINSTIADNTASDEGGGIYVRDDGEYAVELTHLTIAYNEADSGGGVRLANNSGLADVSIQNSIVAFNSATTTADNCYGDIVAFGQNLTSGPTSVNDITTCRNFTLANSNPQFLPLANYGGPTELYMISSTGPAVDAAEALLCPPIDQRGYPRPAGAGCDLGAAEADAIPLTINVQRQLISARAAVLPTVVAGAVLLLLSFIFAPQHTVVRIVSQRTHSEVP